MVVLVIVLLVFVSVCPCQLIGNYLVGLVVRASVSRAADPRFDSRFIRGDFFHI